MAFFRQTTTLIHKDLIVQLRRKWFTTILRALIFPIVFMAIISKLPTWINPKGHYGFGDTYPIRSFDEALDDAGSRERVVLVNNGHTTGDIAQVVSILFNQVQRKGKPVTLLENDSLLPATCPASTKGGTSCFGAVTFDSSPSSMTNGNWSYRITTDGGFGNAPNIDSNNNDVQLYILPLEAAVNAAILQVAGQPAPPQDFQNFGYTRETQLEQDTDAIQQQQSLISNALATAFFIGIVGVVYHLVGHIARERETGVSALLESMSPSRRWKTRAARFLAYHLAFDAIYLPGWIISGAIVGSLAFPATNTGYLVLMHLLCGLALTSYSLLAASFFKKAQLSGIIATIIALVLAIAAQLGIGPNEELDVIVQVLSFLFPPMGYVFFFIGTARFESKLLPNDLGLAPVNESTVITSSRSGYSYTYYEIPVWNVTGGFFLGMFAVQILFFPLLALLIETLRHSPSSRGRKREFNDDNKTAIGIRNFSKTYKSTWSSKKVQAVQDLSLDVVAGSITILLGANGSGKSTTLSAVAGLDSLTSGSINIAATGGLGLCPQKNVQWDNMTVREHVSILERFKNATGKIQQHEIDRIIQACDLDAKANARSSTLSGGQKRKLQLAMMFAGGSKVCCADEVSSGIDPLARRKIWEILLAERGVRTILLTTHFLDEADFLSDHIVMLSQGRLKAEGSAAQLKEMYGNEYRVIVARDDPIELSSAYAQIHKHHEYGHTVYHLLSAAEVTGLVSELESKHIYEYSVHGPTIEDVFLKLADEIKRGLEDDRGRNSGSSDVSMQSLVRRGEPVAAKPLDLSTGQIISFWRQMWILFCKRWIVLPHSWLPYAGAAFVPLVGAGLVTRFFKRFEYPLGIPCAQTDGQAYYSSLSDITVDNSFAFGQASRYSVQQLNQSSFGAVRGNITTVNSIGAFQDYFRENFTEAFYGGLYAGSDAAPTIAIPLGGYSASAIYLFNALSNLLSGLNIDVSIGSFATPFFPDIGNTLQVIIYTGLCFSVYPPLFALYTTAERLRNVRALHYSNGIRSTPLWLAYLAFDFWFVLIISVVAYAIWDVLWTGWYHLNLVFAVFFLYGLAATSFSHCVSLFLPSQLGSWATATVWLAATGALSFLGSILTPLYAPGNLSSTWLNYQFFTIGLISPSVSLYRGLVLTLNEFSVLCRGPLANERATNAIAIDVFGGPILYLCLQFIVCTGFLILWEYGWRPRLWPRRKRSSTDDADVEVDGKYYSDPDATEDPQRLAETNDGLRALNLNKRFGSNTAVENVSFGIQKSETFALLGPNGAGKSTIISLIRGDLRPTGNSSEISIQGHSTSTELFKARNHLGVCPQFDAVDKMTVVQHLRFYARARGVPEVDRNVNAVMAGVGLEPYRNRLAAKLSGGNKRKLSLAIALVGNPAALLLDEPSSGMDAAAKRSLWTILKSVTAGRVMLLTTHSMEEADALCQRAAIIARRTLALGSTDELRDKFGAYLSVHMVHRDAPHTSEAELDALRQWVLRNVPGANIETRTYHGQLRFTVARGAHLQAQAVKDSPERGHGSGMLFRLLEAHKEELGIAFYSISPPSLDQVFLSVVGRHAVREENYEANDEKAGRGLLSRVATKLSLSS